MGELYRSVCSLNDEIVKMLIPVSLIFLSALLAGLILMNSFAIEFSFVGANWF